MGLIYKNGEITQFVAGFHSIGFDPFSWFFMIMMGCSYILEAGY